MALELIRRTPTTVIQSPPLLCVHGAWHSATSMLNLLDYFSAHGYRAAAFSLRGHGQSPGRERLHHFGLADYLADLADVVTEVTSDWGQVPILVGHSSGGWLVQKYLESHAAPGAILLASLPPMGVRGLSNPFMRKYPVRFLLAILGIAPGLLFNNPHLVREAFFTPATPLDHVQQHLAQLQVESRRMLRELGSAPTINHSLHSPPMLILGAANDGFLPATAIRSTAEYYATTPCFIPQVGHDLMLDIGWEQTAATMLDWLQLFRGA